MIIFLNEDRAYLYWVAHHRGGFVLDTRRKASKTHQVLHRAICAEIKSSESKRTHWTTGIHVKACAADSKELRLWAEEQTGIAPANCAVCKPEAELASAEIGHDAEPHLTRLGREIVSFVLEVATIHLDEESVLSLHVGAIARCLDKSPAQLTGALVHLANEGLLTILGHVESGQPMASHRGIFPTAKALRMLPVYSNAAEHQIEADLNKLRGQ
jgi:hypothetical protein